MDEQGNIDFDGPIEVQVDDKVSIQALHLDGDFLATCKQLGIMPRMKYRPVITDYTGDAHQDEIYTIAHEEFASLAAIFDIALIVGKTPEPQLAPEATASDGPAPETVEQRRARYLAWFTEAERISKRGALQRVFEREKLTNPKADRSNIGKDIKLATKARTDKNRAGVWTTQLVQDGKRKS